MSPHILSRQPGAEGKAVMERKGGIEYKQREWVTEQRFKVL